MKGDRRWVPLTTCFSEESVKVGEIAEDIAEQEGTDRFELFQAFQSNLTAIRSIVNIEFPIMQVDDSSSLQEALIVFDRVNSQGTPLSDADIALVHMVSSWPETRRRFKAKLQELNDAGFEFDLTFLVRAINAVNNQSAEFEHLHQESEAELQAGWTELSGILDYLINVLRNHAYIYSTKDLNTPTS